MADQSPLALAGMRTTLGPGAMSVPVAGLGGAETVAPSRLTAPVVLPVVAAPAPPAPGPVDFWPS